MGHKVHPTGFRVGVIYDWQSKWYAGKNYRDQLHEDVAIRRRVLGTGTGDAGISKVDIERNANQMTVTQKGIMKKVRPMSSSHAFLRNASFSRTRSTRTWVFQM